MLEVTMSDDIRRHTPALIAGLTGRQIVYIDIGLGITVPIGIGIYLSGMDISVCVVVIVLGIAFGIVAGQMNKNGLHFENYAVLMITRFFLTSQKRKYKTKNSFRELMKSYGKSEERAKVNAMTKAEQKTYEKEKNEKPKVNYGGYVLYK